MYSVQITEVQRIGNPLCYTEDHSSLQDVCYTVVVVYFNLFVNGIAIKIKFVVVIIFYDPQFSSRTDPVRSCMLLYKFHRNITQINAHHSLQSTESK